MLCQADPVAVAVRGISAMFKTFSGRGDMEGSAVSVRWLFYI